MRNFYLNKFVLSPVLVLFLSACSVSEKIEVKDQIFEPSKDYTRNADNLSPEEEDVIGQAVAHKILATYPAYNSDSLNSYVNAVGQVVSAASPRAETFAGYRFLVLDSDQVNALAAPGGYIFISRGFIEKLNDEDSLAAVLAHEVSHIVKRHGLAAIKPQHFADYVKVGSYLGSAVDCAGVSQQLLTSFSAAVEDVYNSLVIAGYSREQEYEADNETLLILENAGYKPESLKKALNLIDLKNSSGGWFSTHPSPSDRITKSQVFIKEVELAKLGYDQRTQRFLKAKKALQLD